MFRDKWIVGLITFALCGAVATVLIGALLAKDSSSELGLGTGMPPSPEVAAIDDAVVIDETPVQATLPSVFIARSTSIPQGSASTPAPSETRMTSQGNDGSPSEVPEHSVPRIYWGTFNIDVPWDIDTLFLFEHQVGKQQSIVHWGQQWDVDGRLVPFNVGQFNSVRLHGSIPMFDWMPMAAGGGEEQPAYRLSEIYNGRYDDYIRSWAEAARDWGHPFFLRHNHEMNGWWSYPWSEQINSNQPGDFVRAWRHVHDIFTDVGATNVTWVWSPNIVYPGATTPLAELYPGDAYVDWVAMDGYNWGSDHENDWQSFAEMFGPTYRELQRLAPGKPMMLAEFGSAETGGDKAAWIVDALEVQVPMYFPEIRAVVWFNWDNDNPDWTFPIGSSPEALEAFRRAISQDIYAGNEFADLNISPVTPPR